MGNDCIGDMIKRLSLFPLKMDGHRFHPRCQ